MMTDENVKKYVANIFLLYKNIEKTKFISQTARPIAGIMKI